MKQLKQRWSQAHPLQRKVVLVMTGALLLMLVIVVAKKISFAMEERNRKQQIEAGPRVQVAVAELSAPERQLTLVGEARPYETVTLYAKVSGFLKSIHVDKGDSVEKGQLLAVIAAPETTQEYEAAAADARNKRAIAERMRPLLAQKLISQQEADQAFADADVTEARARSLEASKGYQEIRAPFAGTVTARLADPGALAQGATPLFQVSKIDRLRIFVYVDQANAMAIRRGLPATVTLDERPDIQIQSAVSRYSGELDPRTRTLLAELDVDNQKSQLVAGSFVKVLMKVQAPSYVQIPSEALVLRQAKEFVPVVTSSNTVTYRPVTIADNDGQRLRLLSGLSAGERVAMSLGNSVEEGTRVQPIAVPAVAQAGVNASSSSAGAPASSSASSQSSSAPAPSNPTTVGGRAS